MHALRGHPAGTVVGGKLVVVLFSGCESTVSRIDRAGARNWPGWTTLVEPGGLTTALSAAMAAVPGVTMCKARKKLEETVSARGSVGRG